MGCSLSCESTDLLDAVGLFVYRKQDLGGAIYCDMDCFCASPLCLATPEVGTRSCSFSSGSYCRVRLDFNPGVGESQMNSPSSSMVTALEQHSKEIANSRETGG